MSQLVCFSPSVYVLEGVDEFIQPLHKAFERKSLKGIKI